MGDIDNYLNNIAQKTCFAEPSLWSLSKKQFGLTSPYENLLPDGFTASTEQHYIHWSANFISQLARIISCQELEDNLDLLHTLIRAAVLSRKGGNFQHELELSDHCSRWIQLVIDKSKNEKDKSTEAHTHVVTVQDITVIENTWITIAKEMRLPTMYESKELSSKKAKSEGSLKVSDIIPRKQRIIKKLSIALNKKHSLQESDLSTSPDDASDDDNNDLQSHVSGNDSDPHQDIESSLLGNANSVPSIPQPRKTTRKRLSFQPAKNSPPSPKKRKLSHKGRLPLPTPTPSSTVPSTIQSSSRNHSTPSSSLVSVPSGHVKYTLVMGPTISVAPIDSFVENSTAGSTTTFFSQATQTDAKVNNQISTQTTSNFNSIVDNLERVISPQSAISHSVSIPAPLALRKKRPKRRLLYNDDDDELPDPASVTSNIPVSSNMKSTLLPIDSSSHSHSAVAKSPSAAVPFAPDTSSLGSNAQTQIYKHRTVTGTLHTLSNNLEHFGAQGILLSTPDNVQHITSVTDSTSEKESSNVAPLAKVTAPVIDESSLRIQPDLSKQSSEKLTRHKSVSRDARRARYESRDSNGDGQNARSDG